MDRRGDALAAGSGGAGGGGSGGASGSSVAGSSVAGSAARIAWNGSRFRRMVDPSYSSYRSPRSAGSGVGSRSGGGSSSAGSREAAGGVRSATGTRSLGAAPLSSTPAATAVTSSTSSSSTLAGFPTAATSAAGSGGGSGKVKMWVRAAAIGMISTATGSATCSVGTRASAGRPTA